MTPKRKNAQDDIALIQRIATQDRRAVDILYARYSTGLFRFLVRYSKNEAIAEELVNEVFMEVWNNAARFEGRSSVSSWMFAIGRNKAISLQRKRSEAPLDEDYASSLEDDGDSPEVVMQKTDKAGQIKQCMAKLTEEHREVIDLVYYHEKSLKDVSEILDIPVNTVKTRLFNARKKLSEHLRNAQVDWGWP